MSALDALLQEIRAERARNRQIKAERLRREAAERPIVPHFTPWPPVGPEVYVCIRKGRAA